MTKVFVHVRAPRGYLDFQEVFEGEFINRNVFVEYPIENEVRHVLLFEKRFDNIAGKEYEIVRIIRTSKLSWFEAAMHWHWMNWGLSEEEIEERINNFENLEWGFEIVKEEE